jgi:hypothetical protein
MIRQPVFFRCPFMFLILFMSFLSNFPAFNARCVKKSRFR